MRYSLLAGMLALVVLAFSAGPAVAAKSSSSLQVQTDTYPCPGGTCWGTVSGSGLKPGAEWFVSILDGTLVASGAVDATGGVNEKLVLPCGQRMTGIFALSTTAAGAQIRSGVVNSPCDASAAATGANRDNAHACRQGGHRNLAHPSTGLPFRNAGRCASHGAKGGVFSSLAVLTDTYPCPSGTCWGTVSGSGLKPDSAWFVFILLTGTNLADGIVDSTGSVSEKLVLPCGQGLSGILAHSITVAGARIASSQVNSPCG